MKKMLEAHKSSRSSQSFARRASRKYQDFRPAHQAPINFQSQMRTGLESAFSQRLGSILCGRIDMLIEARSSSSEPSAPGELSDFDVVVMPTQAGKPRVDLVVV